MKIFSLFRLIRQRRAFRHILKRGAHLGFCPICERRTVFYRKGEWLRDHYLCLRCDSIPRWRAIIRVLNEYFPGWKALRIHESSPSGPTYDYLRNKCLQYVASHFFPHMEPGTLHDGFRCEDLTRQTFQDACFDLVITQDVLEHIPEPISAFREIARTLKPGGAHVFTVPWYRERETLIRAQADRERNIESVEDPVYHSNPVNPSGSLVITDWGRDLCDTIFAASGMTTTVIDIHDRSMGIDAEFIEVFISRKPDHEAPSLLSGWKLGEDRAR